MGLMDRFDWLIDCRRLWNNVTEALGRSNQQDATKEKTILEDNQREAAKSRLSKNETWTPRLFIHDEASGEWIYRHAEYVTCRCIWSH